MTTMGRIQPGGSGWKADGPESTNGAMLDARILPGLPPYGELAISFPVANAFREGMVVEFRSEDVSWVGNFAPRWHPETSVHLDLGERAVVVIAGGAGYVVDALQRTLVRAIQMDVVRIWFEPNLGAMVVSNDLWFAAFNDRHVLWRCPRLSWDGMRDVECAEGQVTGEAYSPLDDTWRRFQLDLSTGVASGGSYNGPEM